MKCELTFTIHCIKYARIRVLTERFFSFKDNQRFCPYTGEYGSMKILILAYSMQWSLLTNNPDLLYISWGFDKNFSFFNPQRPICSDTHERVKVFNTLSMIMSFSHGGPLWIFIKTSGLSFLILLCKFRIKQNIRYIQLKLRHCTISKPFILYSEILVYITLKQNNGDMEKIEDNRDFSFSAILMA